MWFGFGLRIVYNSEEEIVFLLSACSSAVDGIPVHSCRKCIMYLCGLSHDLSSLFGVYVKFFVLYYLYAQLH